MNKILITAITQLTVASGSFAPLTNIFLNFLTQSRIFLQSLTVGVVTCMSIYYKIREITAHNQEEQQFSQKTVNVLIGCAFIFVVPTVVNVIKSFFNV